MSSNHYAVSENHEARMNSPSSSSSVAFQENTRQWFIAALISMSVVINIICVALLYDAYSKMGDRITASLKTKEQTEDLKRYDLDFFKQNDWADLKTRVMVSERLITMLGAGRCGR